MRVKEVRTLLNYPLDLVKEWLHSRNVTSPGELDSLQIDELVKTMCLAWAGNKFGHPNHAANSYQNSNSHFEINRILTPILKFKIQYKITSFPGEAMLVAREAIVKKQFY